MPIRLHRASTFYNTLDTFVESATACLLLDYS
jgi:hypothetical protein